MGEGHGGWGERGRVWGLELQCGAHAFKGRFFLLLACCFVLLAAAASERDFTGCFQKSTRRIKVSRLSVPQRVFFSKEGGEEEVAVACDTWRVGVACKLMQSSATLALLHAKQRWCTHRHPDSGCFALISRAQRQRWHTLVHPTLRTLDRLPASLPLLTACLNPSPAAMRLPTQPPRTHLTLAWAPRMTLALSQPLVLHRGTAAAPQYSLRLGCSR